jgi:hypothetical protein
MNKDLRLKEDSSSVKVGEGGVGGEIEGGVVNGFRV